MGKIMEAIFCVFYLIFTGITGFQIFSNNRENRTFRLYGIMSLVLVFGDAFHLIPRVFSALNPGGDYTVALGYGKLITSITMTIFYLILYIIFEQLYEKKNTGLKLTMGILAVVRIILCLLPQNDWAGEAPVIWGIYRNIPFAVIGLIMVVLFFQEKEDRTFRWMWLAILLSFAFYIPVVLWADVSPMIGMLMMPKTCMYIWIVLMGRKHN